MSCFSVKCNVLSNKHWPGFREFTLIEIETSPKNFYCWGNIYELYFHAIHELKFGSEKSTLLFGKIYYFISRSM